MSQNISQKVSQSMTQKVSQSMTQKVSQSISQNLSQSRSQNASQSRSQSVYHRACHRICHRMYHRVYHRMHHRIYHKIYHKVCHVVFFCYPIFARERANVILSFSMSRALAVASRSVPLCLLISIIRFNISCRFSKPRLTNLFHVRCLCLGVTLTNSSKLKFLQ